MSRRFAQCRAKLVLEYFVAKVGEAEAFIKLFKLLNAPRHLAIKRLHGQVINAILTIGHDRVVRLIGLLSARAFTDPRICNGSVGIAPALTDIMGGIEISERQQMDNLSIFNNLQER